MARTNIEDQLQSIGLSGHQARVYLRLLELGPLTGAQLAEKAHVPRSKVYEICNQLSDKALLEPESGVPRKFRAMPLSRLIEQRKSQLAREAEELDKRHTELEALLGEVVPHAEPAEGGMSVLQGEARVTRHLRMLVRDARRAVDVLLADGSLRLLSLVIEERPPGIAVRAVHHVVAQDMPKVRRLAELGVAFRHAPSSIPITSIGVDGHQSLLLLHPQSGKGPSSALWSSESSLVAAEEARFALAWKEATPLLRRQAELEKGYHPGTTELLREDDGKAEGFATFVAASVAALGSEGEAVDIVLGHPFLGVAADPELKALLAKHRPRLLLPFPADAASRAIAEEAAGLGEARQVPPWMNAQAMLVLDDTSLVASVDPATGFIETIISTGEPGLVSSFQRVFEAAWDVAEDPRPPGDEPATLWNLTRGTADAEAWLRQVLAIATSAVEVRGPEGAEARLAKLVGDPKVAVRRLAMPEVDEGSLLVAVDGRLLLALDGVRFSANDARVLEAIDTCVLTDSRAAFALQSAGEVRDAADPVQGRSRPA